MTSVVQHQVELELNLKITRILQLAFGGTGVTWKTAVFADVFHFETAVVINSGDPVCGLNYQLLS